MATAPQQPPLLVRWEQIDLLVSGERLAEIAGREIAARAIPVTQLTLQFDPGALRADGRLQKGISIPFTVVIDRIDAAGTELRIHLARASAFGIPLPTILLNIAQQFMPPGDVAFDSATQSFAVRLDRFLPPFVQATIAAVRLIAGGVAVQLGPGGADPPPQT